MSLRWPDSTNSVSDVPGTIQYAPSGFVYLLDNCHLLRGGREPDVAVFSGGGQGGRIQECTWSGGLVSDYLFAYDDHLLHHDVEMLSNGNILTIAWEVKSLEAVQQMGSLSSGSWTGLVV